MRKERRRRIIVKKGFQTRILVLMVGVALFTSVMVGSTIYSLTWYQINRLMSRGVDVSFTAIFQAVNRLLVLILPGVVLGVLLASIWFSHRIAGPLYRLGKTMRMVAQGELPPPIKFRKHDEFQDLADDFNTILAKLKSSVGEG